MGLDCYIRKYSKAKAHAAEGRHSVPDVGGKWGQAAADEIGYWRSHRELNRWMMDLARSRVSPERADTIDIEIMNGAPILLREEDLMALKMEAAFGDLFRSYWQIWDTSFGDWYAVEKVKEDIEILDRAMRIAKCNRSYIYYVASW